MTDKQDDASKDKDAGREPEAAAEAPEEAAAAPEEDGRGGAEAAPAGADGAPEEDGGGPDADAPEEDGPEREIAGLKDKLLRALAEMENLRRRTQKEKEDARRYGAAALARDMLPVADNLRRAVESLPGGEDGGGAAAAALAEGVRLVEKSLLDALERHGIARIEPAGEKFDPRLHEAMFEMPAAGAEPGTVAQVLETGYVMHDRLLRPAKVAVAKAPAAPEEDAPDEDGGSGPGP